MASRTLDIEQTRVMVDLSIAEVGVNKAADSRSLAVFARPISPLPIAALG
jgi:hypothetical protein